MRCLLLILLLACTSSAADPPKLQIRFPQVVTQPEATPVESIGAEEWYIVDSDVECFFRASVKGVINFKTEPGPLRMRGKFAGGGGNIETREYKGKFITTIEVTGPGTTELFTIPKGVMDDADIVQKTIRVGGSNTPPPVPVGGPYYFIIGRDDPNDPTFKEIMKSPAWKELITAGHSYAQVNRTQAAALGLLLPDALPAVITLKVVSPTKSDVVRGAIALPSTDDTIRRLPEGVSK